MVIFRAPCKEAKKTFRAHAEDENPIWPMKPAAKSSIKKKFNAGKALVPRIQQRELEKSYLDVVACRYEGQYTTGAQRRSAFGQPAASREPKSGTLSRKWQLTDGGILQVGGIHFDHLMHRRLACHHLQFIDRGIMLDVEQNAGLQIALFATCLRWRR